MFVDIQNWIRVAAVSAILATATLDGTASLAADWPMWRFDAGRTAASPDGLPDDLELLWARSGEPRVQAWDDPLNLDLMTYDRLFEPIVLDGRMFVGYSDRDKLVAFDTETGQELWSFFTDAPVRLAPVGWQGRVYFTSDDGRLYCVDAETGTLQWQFFGGPRSTGNFSNRRVIGNQRLISAWPARGGPVLRDGQVYFASSIWPFMGVFIYSMDAETGEIQWVNDSSGAAYIKQPHSAPSFAGIGPQGALVATEKDLIVPGGRSVPAVFDRQTGAMRYFELNAGGKGTGGSFVMANDTFYFVHTRLKGVREFDLASGDKTAFMPNEPVLHGSLVYSAEETKSSAAVIRAYGNDRKVVWEIEADGRGDLILAGNRLYAAGVQGLTAIALPDAERAKPEIVWSAAVDPAVDGPVERLLAADDKLFAVTAGGDILAFGSPSETPTQRVTEQVAELQPSEAHLRRATEILAAGEAQGYALWFGAADEELALAIAQLSPFVQLAIVDEDAQRVERLRQQIDRAGRYGTVTVHHSTPEQFSASPYLAHQVFAGAELSERLAGNAEALKAIYEAVRPYGGTLQLLAEPQVQSAIAEQVTAMKLERAEVEPMAEAVRLTRVGALPGSGDWTHQHGNIANTRKSDDARVRLPLGLLWFGGSSNMDVLPRHGHGPSQQVVDGKLYIQGIDVLSCRDVYTGRVLWQRRFDDLGTFDVYYNDTYKETPLDPSYNQVHIPGANARGTNYVVTADRVYIVEGSVCHVLDSSNGELLQDIALPQEDSGDPNEWGFLGVYGDVLIGGVGFAKYRERLDLSFEEEDAKLSGNKAGFGSKSLDRAGSMALVGMDRKTGSVLWKIDARHSFWHNGIVAGGGRIYCLDKHPQPVEDKLRRRGRALPNNYRIVAIEPTTGDTLWEVEEGVFGTWLSYSEQHDLLLQAGAAASDRLAAEVSRGMAVYRGKDGTVQWRKDDLKYSGPCILHNDLIITNSNAYSESAGAFYLESGDPYWIDNPLTGQPEQWKITRAYGCNTILASENLLTFRSGAAGFYDLTDHGGTGNLGGFKSGCTGNLIAAGGVLNAPDYTRTCSCSYQNQTSLALVHMPEIEVWTVNVMAKAEADGQHVHSLGINLGAPGQRRDAQGLLWFESPSVTDNSPVEIEISGDAKQFARHSSAIADAHYPWVFASGVEGEAEIRIGMLLGKPQPDQSQRKPQKYRVRLFFGTPEIVTSSGPRVFDIAVQDQVVSESITLEDGQTQIREVEGVLVEDQLRVRLIAKQGLPVLSGIELHKVNE